MNASALRGICGPVLVGLLPWLPGTVASVSASGDVRAPAGDAGSRIKVELFVMAHCPYGMRAEAALAPTVKAFGDGIDFRLHFIAQEAGKETVPAGPLRPLRSQSESCESSAVSGTGRFLSLHGDAEVEEGIRQVVMMHLYPDRFYDYILDRNENMESPDWQASARRAGINPERVAEIASGAEGEALFGENIRRANQLGVGASPTLCVDGVEVKGGVETQGLARRICGLDSLAGPCASVPVCGTDRDCVSEGRVGVCTDAGKPSASCRFSNPVVFTMTVLNDTDCDLCDPSLFVRSTRELFPGVRVQKLNLHSRRGRRFADRFQVDRVPAFILDVNFAKTARFQRFAKAVYPIRGSYMPKPVLVPVSRVMGRRADPGRMDFYFAGSSPATIRIAGNLQSWLDAVDAPERLRLHPMGQGEKAFPNLCIRHVYPERYRAYAMCVFRGISKRTVTEPYAVCLKQQEIDAERIGRCAEADGAALAARSRVSAGKAGIDLSMNPSLVLNGRFVVTSRMLPQARELFYRLNPELLDRDKAYMENRKK